jgi:capping protein alpha
MVDRFKMCINGSGEMQAALGRVANVILSVIKTDADRYSVMVLQELRRKLPVTRTLFQWDKALQLSLTREITREFSNKR